MDIEKAEAVLKVIYTIGYQGTVHLDFIQTLVGAGISLLVDVRQIPQSRRPGFSKCALAAALAEAGISYRHVRQLGDPKLGRDAARRGAMDEFRSIFNAHLNVEASRQALHEVAEVAWAETIVLMCYERDPRDCHRLLVAQRLEGLNSFETVHLCVQAGCAVGREIDGAVARKLVGAC